MNARDFLLAKALGKGSGVSLPTLSSPASASDIYQGTEAIDQSGAVVVGTNPYNAAVVDPIKASALTAIADKGVATTGDEALSEIPGLIEEIQVGDGGSETLDDLIDRSITEINSNAEIVGSNAFYYCSRLATANFPVCTIVSIGAFYGCTSLTTASFPVCTSMSTSAFAYCASLTTANFPACTSMGTSAFAYCSRLTTANFPVCTSVSNGAFYCCYSLTSASFPVCTSIASVAFFSCSSLTTVSFPVCTSIASNAFGCCTRLTTANFPACTSMGSGAFRSCYVLSALILSGSSLCTLANSNAFSNASLIQNGTGYIYVPSSLVDAYKSATNWTYFSAQISAIEDSEFA